MVGQDADNGKQPRIVILGGGVAGLAAGVRLAQRGVAVTLIETSKRLGGRATSFVDPATGELLDNCQHVLMRCCTTLIDLYERLGVSHLIDWHGRYHFAGPDGDIDVLEANDLPAPAHLARSLTTFRCLDYHEKIDVIRGMRAILRTSKRQRKLLGDVSFNAWLRTRDQPDETIRKFWDLIIASACNEFSHHVSARYALQVFHTGMLANSIAYEMGLAAVPLRQLYDPAEQVIQNAGGEIHFGKSADAILHDQGRVTGVRCADGSSLPADILISALPFDRLDRIIDYELRDRDYRLAQLHKLRTSPILGLHLFYALPDEQPLLKMPFVALVGSALQWVFTKGVSVDDRGRRVQHLHGVISAAHRIIDEPADILALMAHMQLARYLEPFENVEPARYLVIKEKRATFSIRPGVDRLRPTTTGTTANLLLAGDWCDTGWPATMEGAARSGYQAAAAALERIHQPVQQTLPPELPPATLVQMLGGR